MFILKQNRCSALCLPLIWIESSLLFVFFLALIFHWRKPSVAALYNLSSSFSVYEMLPSVAGFSARHHKTLVNKPNQDMFTYLLKSTEYQMLLSIGKKSWVITLQQPKTQLLHYQNNKTFERPSAIMHQDSTEVKQQRIKKTLNEMFPPQTKSLFSV